MKNKNVSDNLMDYEKDELKRLEKRRNKIKSDLGKNLTPEEKDNKSKQLIEVNEYISNIKSGGYRRHPHLQKKIPKF